MKKKRKGQVALEFLMTYGWAFLIILVVIGAFIYFDVLNPSRNIGGRCTMTAGFYCNAHVINAGSIQLEVRNDQGKSLDNLDVTITETLPTPGTVVSCTGLTNVGTNEVVVINCPAPGTADPGERFQGDILIQYQVKGSSITQTATGGISGQVI